MQWGTSSSPYQVVLQGRTSVYVVVITAGARTEAPAGDQEGTTDQVGGILRRALIRVKVN